MGWFIHFILAIIDFTIAIFIGFIDICDALLVIAAVGFICTFVFNLHSGISFLIGLAFAIPLYFLFTRRIGFWIVTTIFSALWAWVFVGFVVKGIFGAELDTIWYWIWFGGSFLINIATHQYARDRNRKMIEEDKPANPVHVEEYSPPINFETQRRNYDPVAEYEAARKRGNWK